MSKKRSYSTLEALLRQNQQRIRDLERQLAESKKQLEAAKRSARAAKSEVKKLKSEVIKPQEVKVSQQSIKPITVKELKPINIKETKSADLSDMPKELRQRIYARRIYIPQFINRLRQFTNLTEVQLFELEVKLGTMDPSAIDDIFGFYDVQSMYYGSGQDFTATIEDIRAEDLYADIMAHTD